MKYFAIFKELYLKHQNFKLNHKRIGWNESKK